MKSVLIDLSLSIFTVAIGFVTVATTLHYLGY